MCPTTRPTTSWCAASSAPTLRPLPPASRALHVRCLSLHFESSSAPPRCPACGGARLCCCWAGPPRAPPPPGKLAGALLPALPGLPPTESPPPPCPRPPQVRTQTLVKGCIIQVDAAPFKQWYQQHYGVEVGIKKRAGAAAAETEAAAQSNHVKRKLKSRCQGRKLDSLLDDQFATGRVYACLSSRPGQVRSRSRSQLPWGAGRRDGGSTAWQRGTCGPCLAAPAAGAGQLEAPCVPGPPLCAACPVPCCSAAAPTATSWRAASWSSTSRRFGGSGVGWMGCRARGRVARGCRARVLWPVRGPSLVPRATKLWPDPHAAAPAPSPTVLPADAEEEGQVLRVRWSAPAPCRRPACHLSIQRRCGSRAAPHERCAAGCV